MNRKILDVLCCPQCKAGLELVSFEGNDHEVESGVLLCEGCGAYPVHKGIPRFHATCWAETGELAVKYGPRLAHLKLATTSPLVEAFLKRSHNTKESFGFEWMRYHFDPQDESRFRDHFLTSTGIPEAWFDGKLVLDVGCGMGRYPRVVSKMGAEIVALDVSRAVERVKSTSDDSPRVHPIQGDLLNPPFKERAFDLVYSIGVLHHTPDSKRALTSIATLPRVGGILAVQVYGRMKREWLNTALRSVTMRLPRKLLYYLCLGLVPVPSIPVLRTLFRPIPYSEARRWQERWNSNFDWYSCEYQHRHTTDEVSGWLEELGFVDVKVLPKYEVSIRGLRSPGYDSSVERAGISPLSDMSSLWSTPE